MRLIVLRRGVGLERRLRAAEVSIGLMSHENWHYICNNVCIYLLIGKQTHPSSTYLKIWRPVWTDPNRELITWPQYMTGTCSLSLSLSQSCPSLSVRWDLCLSHNPNLTSLRRRSQREYPEQICIVFKKKKNNYYYYPPWVAYSLHRETVDLQVLMKIPIPWLCLCSGLV